MNEMFPDARWMNERVLGVIKSLVAARLGYEIKRNK